MRFIRLTAQQFANDDDSLLKNHVVLFIYEGSSKCFCISTKNI